MRLFRIAASVLLGLASLGSASAEQIANWAAPLYWRASSESQPRDHHAAMEAKGVTVAATAPLPFVAVSPCRVADTRGNGFSGAYGPPRLSIGVSRDFPMTGVCGIPATAQAVSMNLTVTNTLGPGYITIYPHGGTQPTVSTLNYVANVTVANAAVGVLGTGGGITVLANVSGTDFVIDVNGYYDPQGVVNTVNGLSGDMAIAPGANISITLSGNVLLAPGTNVSITPSGNTLTVSSTGFALTANNSGSSTFTGAGLGSATITGDITASSIIQCTYTGTGVTSKPIIVESQGVGSAVVRGESGTTFRYVI